MFSDVIYRQSANVGHHPPPPSDPNFQQIVDFMRGGNTDSTTLEGTEFDGSKNSGKMIDLEPFFIFIFYNLLT